jgi:signal transduction histidine kinase/CheY-like chemotaxis protein
VPILALSGFRSILEKSAGKPGGFTECLLKPIEPSRLVEVVRRYLPRPNAKPVDSGHPAAVDAGAPAGTLEEELRRQIEINVGLARRCALHDAQLAIIGGVAEALARSEDIDGALDDVLAACLDAGGVSRGALYRLEPDETAERAGRVGKLVARQAVGFDARARDGLGACFGHAALVDQLLGGHTVLPARSLDARQAEDFLARAQAKALVFVPLLVAEQCRGALLLASDLDDVGDEDLLAFGRAIVGYVNQALGLTAAFARLDSAAEIQRTLFASLDIDETSRTVAQLGTRYADVCEIELVHNQAVVHSDRAERDPRRTQAAFGPDRHVHEVPLLANGTNLGRIWFGRALPFGPADRRGCDELARPAAAALHKALLYQEAQVANVAKDDFLATMSHELRTPLTAILLWTEKLMRKQHEPAVLERGLGVIHQHARQQSQLIEDILDVSRIVTGKLALQYQLVDLEVVARAAVQVISPSAEAKGISVELDFDTDAGPILGDSVRLQQVMWNLLNNAVKFTPARGHIVVTLGRRGSQIELRVRDTGKGIDPAFLPFVFDRFRQADNTPTRADGGLGLGLALVKNLVELHGGSVRAESPGPGQGATLIVSLPVPAVLEPHAPPFAAEGGLARSKPHRLDENLLRGVRLLVVDDEPDVREMIAELLADCGAEVRAAGSVADAMDLFEHFHPTVLVSDLGMPKEDGYDLIRRIRMTSTIPALALTAFAGAEDKRKVLASGFQMHMPKPVRLDALLEAISRLAVDRPQAPS